MKTPENNNWLDDVLTNAIGSDKVKPDFEQWLKDHPQAVEILTERAKQKPSVSHSLNFWRIIMKSSITKLAAAAVITVAILAGIYYFGISLDGTRPAFAEVVKQISNARTVTYKKIIETEEGKWSYTEMINESGVMRTVRPSGDIIISDLANGVDLDLMPDCNRAILTHIINSPYRQSYTPFLERIKTLCEKDGKFTGYEEIDGISVDVFLVQQEKYAKTTVWVNPKTNLPVRIEFDYLTNPDKGVVVPCFTLKLKDFGRKGLEECSVSMSGSNGLIKKMKVVLSDFVWNAELDESLFSFEPPKGYTLEKIQTEEPKPSEKDLVATLAFWTEMTNGAFPPTITELGDSNNIEPMLVQKFNKGGIPREELNQAMEMARQIMRGLFFAQQLKIEKNFYYAGNGARLGDTDKPICWWKPENSENWRVIYADLSIGDATASELPQTQ